MIDDDVLSFSFYIKRQALGGSSYNIIIKKEKKRETPQAK